ncbi:hypothetical protein CUMW_154290, partial [Citrus unshiu]
SLNTVILTVTCHSLTVKSENQTLTRSFKFLRRHCVYYKAKRVTILLSFRPHVAAVVPIIYRSSWRRVVGIFSPVAGGPNAGEIRCDTVELAVKR